MLPAFGVVSSEITAVAQDPAESQHHVHGSNGDVDDLAGDHQVEVAVGIRERVAVAVEVVDQALEFAVGKRDRLCIDPSGSPVKRPANSPCTRTDGLRKE